MKTFLAGKENQQHAIEYAMAARLAGQFHAFGTYWDGARGNVSGVMYHRFLKPGEAVQACPGYAEQVHHIPLRVQYLIDDFFGLLSCLPDKSVHQEWAETVYAAIRIGADLTAVPDRLALWMLETPSVLHDYADEKGSYYIGALRAAFALRLHGVNQDDELARIRAEFDKLHRARFEGDKDIANHAMAALRAISNVQNNPHGSFYYFLEHAARGMKRNQKLDFGQAAEKLAAKFLELVKEA